MPSAAPGGGDGGEQLGGQGEEDTTYPPAPVTMAFLPATRPRIPASGFTDPILEVFIVGGVGFCWL